MLPPAREHVKGSGSPRRSKALTVVVQVGVWCSGSSGCAWAHLWNHPSPPGETENCNEEPALQSEPAQVSRLGRTGQPVGPGSESALRSIIYTPQTPIPSDGGERPGRSAGSPTRTPEAPCAPRSPSPPRLGQTLAVHSHHTLDSPFRKLHSKGSPTAPLCV